MGLAIEHFISRLAQFPPTLLMNAAAVIANVQAEGARPEARGDQCANPREYRGLACGDDEAVVFDPDGFNLGGQLEFVSISGRVEQLMDDIVEGQGWNG